RVVTTSSADGNTTTHQPPSSSSERASDRMLPMLAMCGGRPSPRKLSAVSCHTACGSTSTADSAACGTTAGNTCLRTTCNCDAPPEIAASTNGCWRSDSTSPRTILATVVQWVTTMDTMTAVMLPRYSATM